jgi:hypothetical protein
MHQDINVKFFLELHNIIDFFLDETDIIFLRDPIDIVEIQQFNY